MKKFLLALVAMVMVAGVSAQNWSIGGRVGSGVQVVGQYDFNKKNYLEGRFGAAWLGGVTADFTALYNWKICTMDWTPNGGDWFFDAGVGVNVGGAAHYAYVGVAGMARLGYNFRKAPLSLSVDYTPVIGPAFTYGGPDYGGNDVGSRAAGAKKNNVGFRATGLANVGITCTYHF